MVNETYHQRGLRVHGYKIREHPLYLTWSDMKSRCNNAKQPGYENYGARGITYCERWKHFLNFAEDMWPKPFPEAQIERKDNEQGYSPENCTWATKSEQMHNRRIFRTNSSGFTGVVKHNGRFNARYDHQSVRYNLGFFTTASEASDFRDLFISKLAADPKEAMLLLERRVRSDSTVGIKGVSAHSKGGYVVRVTRNGERVYLGYSVNLLGAIALLGDAR